MSATALHLSRTTTSELRLFLREPAAMFFTLVLPVLLLVLNGSTNQGETLAGVSAIDILVPGFIARHKHRTLRR